MLNPYLTEGEYIQAIIKILSGKVLQPDEASRFVQTVSKFESLLDDADNFLAERWKSHIYWDVK